MAGAPTKLKDAKKPAKSMGSRPVDYRIDDFVLDTAGSKFDLDIGEALLSADLEITIEGASTLTVTVEDTSGNLLQSATLTQWSWGNALDIGNESKWLRVGRTVDARLDDISFRLVKVSKTGPSLTFTFEEKAVSLLRGKTGARNTPREQVTRAQFVRTLITEVKTLPAYIPELKTKQPVATSDNTISATQRSDEGKAGFAKGSDIKIKNAVADAGQLKQITICMDVADKLGANELATKAMLCAAIGESEFRQIPNRAGSPYAGVFQAHPKNIPMRDTAQQCEYFFKGGKGFQAGGALALARENPGISPGEIATRVEASGQAPSFYGANVNEAAAIMNAWGRGSSSSATFSSSTANATKNYQFARGKNENSWDAIGRLAEEVQWRRFMRRGKLWYVSEDFLFRQRPELIISEDSPGVDAIDFDIDMFARPIKGGRVAAVAEVRVQARADTWTALPGMVVTIKNMGVADGRWLVSTVNRSLLDDAQVCDITLRKPIPKKLEPAEAVEASATGVMTGASIGGDVITPGSISGDTSGLNATIKEFLALVAGSGTESISVSSGLRPADSDSLHSKGQAADINVGGDARSSSSAASKGDNIATCVLMVCGEGRNNASQLARSGALNFSRNFKWKGHTIEVGWRCSDHYDHVHVGFET